MTPLGGACQYAGAARRCWHVSVPRPTVTPRSTTRRNLVARCHSALTKALKNKGKLPWAILDLNQ